MKTIALTMCLITFLWQHELRRELTQVVRKVDMKYGHLVKSSRFWQSKYYEEIRKEYSKRGLEIRERDESTMLNSNRLHSIKMREILCDDWKIRDCDLARHVYKSS